MKFLKAVYIILLIGVLIGCGSSGGGDNDDGGGNNGGNAVKSASGTYSYDADTQTLTVTFSSSSYGDCGPSVGTSTSTVVSITSDTMIINSPDAGIQNWSRSNGAVGDITGTWQLSDDGMNLTLTTRSDGSLTVSGTIDCDDGGSNGGNEPIVGTWKMTDIQGIDLPSGIPMNAVVFTESTYAVTVEGDCSVSGIYTSDVSSIWLTSTLRTGNTDGFCDYHDTPHRLDYAVTASTLIITEDDVVITLMRQ